MIFRVECCRGATDAGAGRVREITSERRCLHASLSLNSPEIAQGVTVIILPNHLPSESPNFDDDYTQKRKAFCWPSSRTGVPWASGDRDFRVNVYRQIHEVAVPVAGERQNGSARSPLL